MFDINSFCISLGMMVGYALADYFLKKYKHRQAVLKEANRRFDIVEEKLAKIGYSYDSNDNPGNSNDNRSSTDCTGRDTDGAMPLGVWTNVVYESKESAEREVEGNLHLVEENELTENDISKEDDRSDQIVGVSPAEFIQAAASGELIRSLLFNPKDQNLYWNFTNALIDDSEAKQLIGSSHLKSIRIDSEYNAEGWIQTRYYYDTIEHVYLKIEVSFDIN